MPPPVGRRHGAAMTASVSQQVAHQELGAGTDFVVAEWTAPAPPPAEREPTAPVHVHRGDDEAWYVLEGALGFVVDGVELPVPAGGAALARAGVAHT
ncbi:hypothetical protein GCM10009616_15250 [Microlunatus lacustris]